MDQTLSRTQGVDTLTIARREYVRLKELEKNFGYFLNFAKHVADIMESRADKESGKGIEQDKVFKELAM